ncbi:hypothetical protein [Solirubrobacter soli]|uniref:hypothetical protein n=1 Tax=Solirubrobacter soli TaxID=363832 RepID=UPI00146B020E|nr:hypothetical protein [Solirubrobacter soli]
MRAIIVVGLAACVGAFAAPARAGEYVVQSCDAAGPHGRVSGWSGTFSGWAPSDSGRLPPVNDRCAEGMGFGVDFNVGLAQGPLAAFWRFEAPADTAITTLVLRRQGGADATSPGDGAFDYVVRDGSGSILETNPSPPWTIGGDANPFPGFAERVFGGLTTRYVTFGMSCTASGPCGAGFRSFIRVGAARITLRDDVSPSSSATTITTDDTGAILVPFADRGGGLQKATLLIDDRAVDSTVLCEKPFLDPVPCPTAGTLSLDASGDASSNVQVELIDASGNRSLVRLTPPAEPGPSVDSTAIPAPGGVSAAPPLTAPSPSIAGVLKLERAGSRRVRYSAPPVVKGTVKASDGSPLAGLIVTTSDGTSAKTDSKGRFSVKLAKGASREVRISYGDSVQTVKVVVAAPIRLKTDKTSTRNGRSITFTGSVPGAENASTLVELQALAHGKWMAFKTAPLRNGKFKAGYRFLRTFFTQRYTFRAVIHDTPGFPYAAGTSNRVKVTVRA